MILITFGVFIAIGLIGFSIRAIALIKPIKTESSTFFNNTFEIVAHRGGSLEAPENTLVAFEKASKIADDIIFELDVHLTKDKQLVVIHDSTIERTTNGKGQVKDYTAAELMSFDAGYHFANETGEYSWRGNGVKIPLLSEIITKFPNRMIIEMKSDETNIEDITVQIIQDARASNRIMIGSQNGLLLARFRKLQPSWNYSASRDDVLRALMLLSIYLEPVGSWAANAFLIPEKDGAITVLSEGLIKEVQRRKKKVLIWTVNEENDMRRLKSLGVNGLITDRPSVAYRLKNL